jgi:signal transduction histidine kinase
MTHRRAPARVDWDTHAGAGVRPPHQGHPRDEAHAAELREARRRIIEAGDVARRHLARDIHDGAQQQLVAAVISLQVAQRKWQTDRDRSKQLLDSALAQAEAGLESLRELVAGIHPPILTHLGLTAAIEALAAKLPIPVRLDLIDRRLAPEVETSVYYFVSEGLTNTIKHAHASSAGVRVAVADHHLEVEVSDDGVGGVTMAATGSGLIGLADRIGALGGELGVTSAAGGGTMLHARIPLD